MNILVTGGAGCIGSDLAEALVARGEHVVVVDNLTSGKREHMNSLVDKPNFRFVEGDIEDAAVIDSILCDANVEMVYHLSANPDIKFVEGDGTDKDLRQNT